MQVAAETGDKNGDVDPFVLKSSLMTRFDLLFIQEGDNGLFT